MSSQIIKLRETEAHSKNKNGDFSIVLNKPCRLEAGDRLSIKTAILDTISSAGQFIELADDVPIHLSVGKYIINSNADTALKKFNPIGDFSDPSVTRGDTLKGDFSPYLLAERSTTPADTFVLEDIDYNVLGDVHAGRMVGGIDIYFSYLQENGKRGSFNFNIREQDAINIKGKHRKAKANIRVVNKDIRLVTDVHKIRKVGLDSASLRLNYGPLPVAINTAVALPRAMPFDFVVPKGIYTPTELGTLITDEMTKLDQYGGGLGSVMATDDYPANNPFLTTIVQDATGGFMGRSPTGNNPIKDGDGNIVGANANQCFVRADGRGILFYDHVTMRNTSVDRWLGANEIALSFDDDHKKMAFNIAHFPVYVNGSAGGNDGLPGVEYISVTTGNPPTVPAVVTTHIYPRYSGVCFFEMKPEFFWQDYLGFVGNSVSIEQTAATVAGDAGAGGVNVNIVPFTFSLKQGIHTTTAFQGIDVPVKKNDDFATPNTTGKISTNDTTPMLGTKVFSSDVENEGYYLVELDFPCQQDFVGGDNNGWSSNKINSIVSNYQTMGSFTSDQGQGSVNYVHQGAPVDISSFHIRILNSNGNVPQDGYLGDKNNIFLEVIRANRIN